MGLVQMLTLAMNLRGQKNWLWQGQLHGHWPVALLLSHLLALHCTS
jgi:hypothetical protein